MAAQDNDNPVLGGKGTEEDPYRKQGVVVTPKGNYPEGYYFAYFSSVEDRTGKPISEQMERQQGSKSDAMELERLEAEAAIRNEGILDGVQGILDVAGMVPAVGEIADGINALIYFARGDNVNGFISLAAMIPVVGQVATTAKLATKGGKFLKAGKQYIKSSLKIGQEMHKSYKVGEEGIKEFRLPSGKRIDFLDINNKTIHELKPYNPRGIQQGEKQLQIYKQELQTIPRF